MSAEEDESGWETESQISDEGGRFTLEDTGAYKKYVGWDKGTVACKSQV